MRDQDGRLLEPAIQLPEHVQNDFRIFRIQAAGRLVSQQDRRAIRDCAGDRHSLLFATGQFEGLTPHLFFDHQ